MSEQPYDIALMDQALAEAREDLLRLVGHLRQCTDDRARSTSGLVQGLLDHPEWDRLMLASVLGAAVVFIVEHSPEATDV
jgi:hypothetical protein